MDDANKTKSAEDLVDGSMAISNRFIAVCGGEDAREIIGACLLLVLRYTAFFPPKDQLAFTKALLITAEKIVVRAEKETANG